MYGPQPRPGPFAVYGRLQKSRLPEKTTALQSIYSPSYAWLCGGIKNRLFGGTEKYHHVLLVAISFPWFLQMSATFCQLLLRSTNLANVNYDLIWCAWKWRAQVCSSGQTYNRRRPHCEQTTGVHEANTSKKIRNLVETQRKGYNSTICLNKTP